MSPDGAIRVAAKLAIDAGDLSRARALLDLLDVERSTPIAILTPSKSPDSGSIPMSAQNDV
jgi:hypothetical protein